LYTWTFNSVQYTPIDITEVGTKKTVLDCNPYSKYIGYFLVQEISAGITKVRVLSLDWTSDPIDVTVYPVLSSTDSMMMNGAVLMQGNTSYGYFAIQTMNIYKVTSNFSYKTAALYYSGRNFGNCIAQEASSSNQAFYATGL
jgi:hypothetical protein